MLMAAFEEDLLHFVWKYKLFYRPGLRTASGLELKVISVGQHNRNAGPDFELAKLVLGQTQWNGHVEIHKKASEWYAHRHHLDKAYNNVILHVVYEDDAAVTRADGTPVETLPLKALLPLAMLAQYDKLRSAQSWIPCATQIGSVHTFKLQQWLSRVLVERLEEKSAYMLALLKEYKGDWNEVAYIALARNFGFKVNGFAFEQLARSLPYKLLLKYRHQRMALEALLFGQAGFLSGSSGHKDDYFTALKDEYLYLRKQHGLKPMDSTVWKFMRMRPANFPTVRLAQFAALCAGTSSFFATIIDDPSHRVFIESLNAITTSGYWQTHYLFHKEAPMHTNNLGKGSVQNIMINTASLLLFAYGKYVDKETYICSATSLLESLLKEKNAIVDRFSALGVNIDGAAGSQALLQLKRSYCDRKRCLECGVGFELFKQNERL